LLPKTLDIEDLVSKENLAHSIGNSWDTWTILASPWLELQKEKRNFLFATDTSATAQVSQPWRNTTTIPKLTQVRDTLFAAYDATLFPNDDWFVWEGDDENSDTKQKKETIQAFVRNKTKASKFKQMMTRLLLDWIDYGNCFAKVKFVNETIEDPDTGERLGGYVGPKLMRISPLDIKFDPTATEFDKTPKIIRSLVSIGQLTKKVKNDPDNKLAQEALKRAKMIRGEVGNLDEGDVFKDGEYSVDGFSSYQEYLRSDNVEVLTFYGDLYDDANDELLENYKIVIIDRMFVISKAPVNDWMGDDHIYHAGWRLRPDNLYAMGPLDNLVGLQYRMDHLENLRADAFDMIGFPIRKISGDVEAFEGAPGEDIFIGDEGDVTYLTPDTTALTADTQIDIIERRMEEMAGAPREAIGLRTPGEKTAFEVQTLDNASNRLFQSKTDYFEEEFVEPILNSFLSIGRQRMVEPELLKILSSDIDVVTFRTIQKDDLEANGKLRPVGSSHFKRRALLAQNLVALLNSPVGIDDAIKVHTSGKKIAKIMEEALGLERFGLVKDNIRVFEQLETQKLATQANEQAELAAATPTEDIL